MIWSRLRKQIRAFTCEELRDRIDVHRAVYRNSQEGTHDRAWITVDGEEVFDLSHGAAMKGTSDTAQKKEPGPLEIAGNDPSPSAEKVLDHAEEEFSGYMGTSFHEYLQMDVSNALRSSNPLIKAFALIDRRVGKRTLGAINITADDHPLVRLFHELRTTESKKRAD